ncbi:hypothetical protein MKW94_020244, partial [Papaver nudicaule]|nr:hypothetical protein [Papaver nudicaule]
MKNLHYQLFGILSLLWPLSVVRRSLVLQLHKIDERREYAEFMHFPRKRFTDFVVNLTLIDHPWLTKVVIGTFCSICTRAATRCKDLGVTASHIKLSCYW